MRTRSIAKRRVRPGVEGRLARKDSREHRHHLDSGGCLPRACVPCSALGERITPGAAQVQGHLQSRTCWLQREGLAASDRPPLGRHLLNVTCAPGRMRDIIEAALALRRATGVGSVREILIEVWEVVVLEEEGRVVGQRHRGDQGCIAGDLPRRLHGSGGGCGVPGEDRRRVRGRRGDWAPRQAWYRQEQWEALTALCSLWCNILRLIMLGVVVAVWEEELGRAQIPAREGAEEVCARCTTEEVRVVDGVPRVGRGEAEGLGSLQLVVGELSAVGGIHGGAAGREGG